MITTNDIKIGDILFISEKFTIDLYNVQPRLLSTDDYPDNFCNIVVTSNEALLVIDVYCADKHNVKVISPKSATIGWLSLIFVEHHIKK